MDKEAHRVAVGVPQGIRAGRSQHVGKIEIRGDSDPVQAEVAGEERDLIPAERQCLAEVLHRGAGLRQEDADPLEVGHARSSRPARADSGRAVPSWPIEMPAQPDSRSASTTRGERSARPPEAG